MMAMAAIVAQNGATGQSLVEQFTTGNLKLDRTAELSECRYPPQNCRGMELYIYTYIIYISLSSL